MYPPSPKIQLKYNCVPDNHFHFIHRSQSQDPGFKQNQIRSLLAPAVLLTQTMLYLQIRKVLICVVFQKSPESLKQCSLKHFYSEHLILCLGIKSENPHVWSTNIQAHHFKLEILNIFYHE